MGRPVSRPIVDARLVRQRRTQVVPRFRSRLVCELYVQQHGTLNIFIIIVVIIIVIVTIAITLINIIASRGSDADEKKYDPRR